VPYPGRRSPCWPRLLGQYFDAVRSPHDLGSVRDNGAVVGVGRNKGRTRGREKSLVTHDPQHPMPANHDAPVAAHARPDLAMACAGEVRRGEIILDGLQHRRSADHRLRAAPPQYRHGCRAGRHIPRNCLPPIVG